MPNYPYSFQLPPLNVQDIPNDGVAGQFLGINGGGQLDWLAVSSASGDMLKSENLSGLADYPTARTNLGLGTTDTPTFKNLVISTGSIATSAPVTISQTWNALAVAFTAFKVNATSTNSASGSLLLDLQVGGTTQFSVTKAGRTKVGNVIDIGASLLSWESPYLRTYSPFSCTVLDIGALSDTILLRDGAANTLALRNGTNAQTFNVYNTYTDTSNYSRLRLQTGSGFVQINAEGAGTGLQNSLYFNAGSTSNNGIISFRTKDVERWNIASAGHLLAGIDNQNDIGANGASRPRNVYVGTSLFTGAGGINFDINARLRSPATDVITLYNSGLSDFGRLQFGGTADSFPAIARDGAGVKFTGAAAGLTSHIKVPAVAVLSLPAAATAGVGARAFVNDALAPVFGNTVATGGAVAVPVYSDGANWKVG
jgi:hypothetical protein